MGCCLFISTGPKPCDDSASKSPTQKLADGVRKRGAFDPSRCASAARRASCQGHHVSRRGALLGFMPCVAEPRSVQAERTPKGVKALVPGTWVLVFLTSNTTCGSSKFRPRSGVRSEVQRQAAQASEILASSFWVLVFRRQSAQESVPVLVRRGHSCDWEASSLTARCRST